MPVRGTTNYVWFTEQPLGSGSTGNVYYGRHKRQGDACAIKVFVDHMRLSMIKAKTAELTLMRKLDQRNIVRLLAIEEETHSKEKILIMEFCSEGSVYDMLNKPEYLFGFPELEYLVFIQDLVSGLEYLRQNDILHRNLKPGNILCSVAEDGKSVYKLIDFVSALKLEDGMENLMLHRDVYSSALLFDTKPNEKSNKAAADLWNIGATLYHMATGQLPFQPYGGQSNKEVMSVN